MAMLELTRAQRTEAHNGVSPEDALAAMAAWGDGDPYEEAISKNALGQMPAKVTRRRGGEDGNDAVNRTILTTMGLQEE